MPTNNHPRGGKGVFGMELRPNQFNPNTFDEIINRQGQYVRWMKARPCPVRTESSHHDLHCTVCHGRGFLYEFQRTFGVYRETSPHGCKNPVSKEQGLIKPFWNPVINVIGVTGFRSPDEGGNIRYGIESFNESEIRISPYNGSYPESYKVLLVDYEIDYWEKYSQTFTSDGESYDYKLNLEMPIQDVRNNSQGFHKSIAKIISVKNTETGNDIPVKTFYDETVYLDVKPELNTYFTIEVYVMPPILAVIHPLTIRVAQELKWDMEVGDLNGITLESWDIGKGDIMTLFGVRDRMEELLVRSEHSFDVLPYFDVFDILGDIIDEDGVYYKKNIDFSLYDYNKIKWNDNNPQSGKRFSVVFYERASYKVMNEKAEINANENKRLPKNLHLKRIGRYDTAPIQVNVKNDDRPVGDWVKEFGGVV